MSPIQRALKHFRGLDYQCVIVERWIPRAKVRKDIWGADILARRGGMLIAVQATDGTSHGKHITKCCENPLVKNWLFTGTRFFVYSESKKGPRGETKHWIPRVTELVFDGEDRVVANE